MLAEIGAANASYQLRSLKDELLLYAVQVGPLSAVKHIVEGGLVEDLNAQDANGDTALHLAAISNRQEVIVYLMAQPGINDCILNNELKQPFQCTNDIEISRLMDQLRTKHIAKITTQLRTAFDSQDYKTLDLILNNSRNKELLDINGTDPYTGDTILLEFVKKNNIKMVEFILKHGADPFKRSSTGKSPEEAAITPEMKDVIQESFAKQNVMDSTSKPQQEGGCPTFKGFLMKWTNFAGGYRLRWFVLDKEARLSYYKSPNDMNNTCRGMIHLAHAMIKVDSSENSKFEIIIQNPSDGTPVRWHLKSEHATETQKWVWVLQNAITFAKDHQKKTNKLSPNNINNNNNEHHLLAETDSSVVAHSGNVEPRVPTTIPELGVARDLESKPVSQTISEANDAAQEFKDLLDNAESDVDLPLHLSSGRGSIDSDHTNTLDRVKSNGPIPDRTLAYTMAPPKIRSSMDSQRSNRTSNSNISSHEMNPSTPSKSKKFKHRLSKFATLGRSKRKHSHYDEANSSQVSFADSTVSSVDDYDDELTDSSSYDLNGSSSDLNIIRNQMNIQLATFRDFLKQAGKDDTITSRQLADTCGGILNTLESLIYKEGKIVNSKYNDLSHKLEKQHKISTIWENSIKQLEFEIKDREAKIVELEDKLRNVKKSLRNSVLVAGNNGHLSLNSKALDFSEFIHTDENSPKAKESDNNNNNNNRNSTSAAALARAKLSALNKPPTVIVSDEKDQIEEEIIPASAPPVPLKNSRVPVTTAIPDEKSFAAPPPLPSSPPPSVPLDPTLAKFLEEEDEFDSEDEFFDAENDDAEVRDMSELDKLETERYEQSHPSDVNNVPVSKTVSQSKMEISSDDDNEEYVQEAKPEDEEPKKIEESEIHQEVLTKPGSTMELKPETTNATAASDLSSWFNPEKDAEGKYVVNGHKLVSNAQDKRFEKILGEHTFKGYNDPLRTSLAPEDNRPRISLWGVLKSLVGKDMTKMTLPVSFNEPTSLLQRNVEVIEYSDLLDKASTMESSILRLVYVAAFAASEYASTVGRIAKPFNPLLGETFEYARPDKGYRCFVEQVSHHPPISALVAESSSWSYYGESNVKTKFLGRSFDIKHLGTWFCELYPDHGVRAKNGETTDMEIYSWKKVNNSVIGIIVGNPTIDNYGDMEIVNHTTGDYMKYTFKPRGWRASSAYEVKGEVFNSKGQLMYTIGGHWNEKIYCKPANNKNAEKFLVWQAAPRTEMMFHLTNFAATLNAPQEHLLPVIACTDTRLRPDQRAMEDGQYDLASEEKNKVEEKQREARKQREIKGEVYEPYFFKRSKHPVTGEEYWQYKGTYWQDRDEGKLKNYKDIF